MASRASLIQSRSIYVGTANSVAPSDGNLIVTGKVGIGTTAPTYELDVVGAGRTSSSFMAGGAINIDSNLAIQITSAGTGTERWIGINKNNAYGLIIGYVENAAALNGVGAYIRQVTSDPIHFLIDNATTAMSIVSGGNVGIGTTAPSYKLDVNGNARVTSTMFFGANAQSYIGYVDADSYYRANGVHYFEGDGSYKGVWTAAGNLGISTTAPATKLEVYGGHNNTTARLYSTGDGAASNASLDMWASEPGVTYDGSGIGNNVNGHPYFGRRNALLAQSYIRFYNGGILLNTGSTTASQTVTVLASGNVGIGTTSPNAPLHIVKDLGTSVSAVLRLRGSNSTARTTRLQFEDYNGTIADGLIDFIIPTAGSSTGARLDIGVDSTIMSLVKGGNVGIGTTSPARKLDVAGSVQLSYSDPVLTLYDTGASSYATTNARVEFNNSYATVGYIEQTGEALCVASTGSVSSVSLFTNGSDRLFVNSSGNVGIGTTSPTTKLEVIGVTSNVNGYADGAIQVTGLSPIAFVGQSNLNPSLNRWGFKLREVNDGDFSIYSYTNSATRLLINSSGNVGIGTTSPVKKLQVSTNASGDGGNLLLTNIHDTNGDTASILFSMTDTDFYNKAGIYFERVTTQGRGSLHFATNNQEGSDNVTKADARLTITRDGNVGIGTTSPTAKFVVSDGGAAGIELQPEQTTDTNRILNYDRATATYMNLRIDANTHQFMISGSERMRLDSAGNVGIGTTSPSYKLDVESSVTPIHLNRTDGNEALIGLETQGTLRGYIGASSTDAFNIYNATPTRMLTVLSGGNVGIGTTTPDYKFEVEGVISSCDAALQKATFANVGSDLVLTANAGATNVTAKILFNSSGAGGASVSTKMIIDGSGNVGIGTTSPSYKLQVNSDAGGYGIVNTNGTVTIGTYIEGSNNYASFGTQSNHGLGFFTNNAAPQMYINTAGNVGIGTTSPSTLLNVMTATNAVDVLRLDNSGGNSGSVQGVTHLAINHFGTGTNPSTRITAYQDGVSGWPGGMYFSTRSLNTDSAPVERMRITSDGNVGIGTTSPQYMLDVNGDAQINASGTGPSYAYVPDGGFGVDSLVTSGVENVALGKPDVWLRIHVDGVAFVFPGYQEP